MGEGDPSGTREEATARRPRGRLLDQPPLVATHRPYRGGRLDRQPALDPRHDRRGARARAERVRLGPARARRRPRRVDPPRRDLRGGDQLLRQPSAPGRGPGRAPGPAAPVAQGRHRDRRRRDRARGGALGGARRPRERGPARPDARPDQRPLGPGHHRRLDRVRGARARPAGRPAGPGARRDQRLAPDRRDHRGPARRRRGGRDLVRARRCGRQRRAGAVRLARGLAPVGTRVRLGAGDAVRSAPGSWCASASTRA